MVERRLLAGHVIVGLAIGLVGSADLDAVDGTEHVELGERDVRQAVDVDGVARDDRVEPAAATLAPRRDTVLVPRLAQRRAVVVEQLRRERAAADAREVRLGDAQDLLDVRGADARAGHGAARRAVGRRDKRVGAVVDVELRRLGALEQDLLAGAQRVVEQPRAVDDVRADLLRVLEVFRRDLVDRVGGHVVDGRQDVIFHRERRLELLAQDLLVE